MSSSADADFAQSIGAQRISSGDEHFARAIGAVPVASTQTQAAQPTWWDRVTAIPSHFISALGHDIQLPSEAAQEFMQQPLHTLAAIPKGLLAGFMQLGRPVANLPHTIDSHIPAGAAMTSEAVDQGLGIQGDPAAQLAELLGAGGPLALGEKTAVKLAAKGFGKVLPAVAENSGRIIKKVLPAVRDTATRAGYWGGFNKAQGGSGTQGIGTSFLADIPGLGAAALKRIPLKIAEKEAQYTTAAGARNPETRTPEEAKQLMQLTGKDFPTSLGSVSGSRRLQKLEGGLSWLPFSTYNRHMESGLYNTDQAAQQLIDLLRGDSPVAHLSDDIHQGLHDARDKAYQNMQNEYAPIESALDHVNFKLTELPNFRKTAQQYLTGEADKAQKGLPSPLPDFTDSQQALLQSYLKKPKPQLNPLTFQYETPHPNLTEARQLESDLKTKARDEGRKGNSDTQKAFNAMAAALRQDYAHNATLHGLTNVVPALEKANTFAKRHYYDVWEKPDIHNLLNGKSNNFYATLTKRHHADLIDQLPQGLKHQLFLSHIAHRIRAGQGGDHISPATLSTLYAKQGLKDADAKSRLLDAPTQQHFKRLLAMNELTKAVRIRKAHVPTGKMVMPVLKYGSAGAVGLGGLLHPWLLPLLGSVSVLGRKGGQYLTDPDTVQRYITGATNNVKKSRFKVPFRGLGVASTLVPAKK